MSKLSAAGRNVMRPSTDAAQSARLGDHAGPSRTGRTAPSAEERNPFSLPSDEDVFRLRQLEREHAAELRATQRTQKLWEKTDYSSTLARTRKELEAVAADVDPVALRKARESKGLVTAATAAIARDRQRDKESMDEFISKKRAIFLVQMSLDIKREEISKLENKVRLTLKRHIPTYDVLSHHRSGCSKRRCPKEIRAHARRGRYSVSSSFLAA
jgi:hypothetical protein